MLCVADVVRPPLSLEITTTDKTPRATTDWGWFCGICLPLPIIMDTDTAFRLYDSLPLTPSICHSPIRSFVFTIKSHPVLCTLYIRSVLYTVQCCCWSRGRCSFYRMYAYKTHCLIFVHWNGMHSQHVYAYSKSFPTFCWYCGQLHNRINTIMGFGYFCFGFYNRFDWAMATGGNVIEFIPSLEHMW